MKEIPGFEGIYTISDSGEVFTSYNKNGVKKLKQYLRSNGYFQVTLVKDKKFYYKSIHRLVAMTYLDNKENKPHVNHIDGNKLNNKVCNLEWCTRSENMQHSYCMGLSKTVSVKQCDIATKKIIRNFKSIAEAQRATKILSQNIGRCCRGISTSAGGFYWSYNS